MNAWAIGLDRQRDFTVSTLADPVRIVIDIALDPAGTPAPTTTGARLHAPGDALTSSSECFVPPSATWHSRWPGSESSQSAVTKSSRLVRIPKTPRK